MSDDLIPRDLRHHWHPCSQMKDYESFPPLEVIGAEGSHLILKDGRKVIDAISSWWCKTLGHGHPRLREALIRQAGKFEHVISANTVQEPLVELSERLSELCPPLDKVFYAGEGSMAVEIALKLSLQAQQIRGQKKRTRFIALENGYHGESGLALAVGDLGLYREPYASVLPEPIILRGIPYVASPEDPLWNVCGSFWPALEAQLALHAQDAAALILEPVLQGAGGMRIYSPDLLRRLRKWTRENGVYLIADEVLTGFWRTGKLLAVQHADIVPDLLCLGKGLTAGWLPFSAVLVHPELHGLFYSEYGRGRDFLHSNTFSGNALGAAVALEALRIYTESGFGESVALLARIQEETWKRVSHESGLLENIRCLGGICAADLLLPPEIKGQRVGLRVFQEAVARGAWLRCLGNTAYWLPPLNSPPEVIARLADITTATLRNVARGGGLGVG